MTKVSVLGWVLLTVALPLQGAEPAAELELFAKEDWYKGQDGKERDFEGLLKVAERGGRVGFGRFNPYRLVMETETREVYVGGKPTVLKPYIERRVRITGKPVEMEVEGQMHREIWPAKLQLLPTGKATTKQDGQKPRDVEPGPKSSVRIVAQGAWPHAEAAIPLASDKFFWAIRSQEEWTKLSGAKGTANLAAALGVPTIDFDKYMVIAVRGRNQPMIGVGIGPGQQGPPPPPSAPSTVEIPRVENVDVKTIRVLWRFVPRAKDQVLTAPVGMVLVAQATGEVEFRQLEAGQEPESAGKELQIVARTLLPDGLKADVPATGWVVRNREELVDPRIRAPSHVIEQMIREQLARYAKALGIEQVDLDHNMLIGVAAGTQATQGTSVQVERIVRSADGKSITVSWRLISPPANKRPAPGLANPAAVVLVEKNVSLLRFDPPAAMSSPRGGRQGSLD